MKLLILFWVSILPYDFSQKKTIQIKQTLSWETWEQSGDYTHGGPQRAEVAIVVVIIVFMVIIIVVVIITVTITISITMTGPLKGGHCEPGTAHLLGQRPQ